MRRERYRISRHRVWAGESCSTVPEGSRRMEMGSRWGSGGWGGRLPCRKHPIKAGVGSPKVRKTACDPGRAVRSGMSSGHFQTKNTLGKRDGAQGDARVTCFPSQMVAHAGATDNHTDNRGGRSTHSLGGGCLRMLSRRGPRLRPGARPSCDSCSRQAASAGTSNRRSAVCIWTDADRARARTPPHARGYA